MGDRIDGSWNCVHCGVTEEEVWYAPTCNSFGFRCQKCGKYNFITTDLEVKKVEDVTYDDVYQAVNNASTMMDEKQIKSVAEEFYDKEILGKNKDGN